MLELVGQLEQRYSASESAAAVAKAQLAVLQVAAATAVEAATQLLLLLQLGGDELTADERAAVEAELRGRLTLSARALGARSRAG